MEERDSATVAPLCADRAASAARAATSASVAAAVGARIASGSAGPAVTALLYFGIDRARLVEAQERDDVLSFEQRIGRAVVAAQRRESVEDQIAARILPLL